MHRLRVPAPPPAILATTFLAGLLLDRLLPIHFSTPAPLALVPLLAGMVLAGWAAVTFRRADTNILPRGVTRHLVPSGPYRFSRNPMYVGMLLVYVGVALALGSMWALMLTPAAGGFLHGMVVRGEERHLEARFGDAYLAYKRQVRRWL